MLIHRSHFKKEYKKQLNQINKSTRMNESTNDIKWFEFVRSKDLQIAPIRDVIAEIAIDLITKDTEINAQHAMDIIIDIGMKSMTGEKFDMSKFHEIMRDRKDVVIDSEMAMKYVFGKFILNPTNHVVLCV